MWFFGYLKEIKASKLFPGTMAFFFSITEITKDIYTEKWVLMTQPPPTKVVNTGGNNAYY